MEKFSLVQKKLMLGIQSSSFENINNISLIFKMMEDIQSNWFKNLMIFDFYSQVYIFVSIVSSWFKKTDLYLKFYMMVNIQYNWFKNLMKFNWYWRYIKQFVWFKKSAGKWWSSYNRCGLKKIFFWFMIETGSFCFKKFVIFTHYSKICLMLDIQSYIGLIFYYPYTEPLVQRINDLWWILKILFGLWDTVLLVRKK